MTENTNSLFQQMLKQKTAMASAMATAVKANNGHLNVARTGQLKDVAAIGVDGTDHINIGDPSATTELGRFMAHNADTPFTHPILGQFASVESLWHWLKSESRNDNYRSLFGKKLRTALKNDSSMGEDLEKRGMVRNFRAMVMDANWLKICQYPALKEAIGASSLPFDMYYVVRESERTRPNFSGWVVRGFEEIRTAIKENREPDFSWGIDNKDAPLYAEEIERLAIIKAAIAASKERAAPAEVPQPDDVEPSAEDIVSEAMG